MCSLDDDGSIDRFSIYERRGGEVIRWLQIIKFSSTQTRHPRKRVMLTRHQPGKTVEDTRRFPGMLLTAVVVRLCSFH
jgi:hypothetical protein